MRPIDADQIKLYLQYYINGVNSSPNIDLEYYRMFRITMDSVMQLVDLADTIPGIIMNQAMPKYCDECWALDEYGDYPMCRITHETRGYNFNTRAQRMPKCPLIGLQLVDRDDEDIAPEFDGAHQDNNNEAKEK